MDSNRCELCNYDPCPWMAYGKETMDQVLEEVKGQVERNERPTNSVIRKRCYRLLMRRWQGFLGKGNREELPQCCLDNVRDEFPKDPLKPKSKYMGHKWH